jgi:DNA polymerase III subunit delta
MIVKYFELKKQNLKEKNFFLLYGNNQGLINETIQDTLKPKLSKNIFNYDEIEVLRDVDHFKENLINKSFFENEKLVIINRVSDKFYKIIEELISRNIEELSIILVASSLDKKSKIRNFFEKDTKTLCIPFYEDNSQTLSNITQKFMREKNINISQQIINVIVERVKGDRINLKNELQKIENFSKNKKNINIDDILKITNLSENYDISELVDSCLAKNKRKMIKILNENNFGSEDCILILRIFLIKLKRLLKLHLELDNKKNIDSAISSYKPTIFWKEKEIVKQQVRMLNQNKTKDLILKTNGVELLIKKNPQISINLTTDFIISQTI